MGGAPSATVRGRGAPDWFEESPAAGLGENPRRLLQEAILPAYLLRCRWYPAKDAGLPVVEIEDVLTCPEPIGHAAMAVLLVTPPGQPPSRYVLPLALAWADENGLPSASIARFSSNGQPAALIDGFESDRVLTGFLDALLAAETAGAEGGFSFGRTRTLDARRGDLATARATRSGAEQSNTSVRYGDVAILKLFRRLETGIHPELEVVRFLTNAGYANTPPLLGWIELHPPRADQAVLAVLQQLVRDAADGWSHVLRELRDHATRHTDAPGAGPPLLDLAERLGQRTAELHRVLAGPSDDPAFAPERVTPAKLGEWTEGARHMAEIALQALDRGIAGLPQESRRHAQALLMRRDQLLNLIAHLVPAELNAVSTRVHGDFHLGQVLVADDDVFIIDFEGEPMRSLDERRGKHSPLRDMAGMLRSFAYAAAGAQLELTVGTEASWLVGWADAMSTRFMDSYRTRVGDCPSLPADPGDRERLLRFFLLEKALYELRYELANRPAWVPIPISGILSLLDRRPV
jgi:trehalose synthase-fused probable maltokinase